MAENPKIEERDVSEKYERSEQELVRLSKLERAKELGYPYPNDVKVSASSEKIHQVVDSEIAKAESDRERFCVAGRIMTMRLMGKAAFFHLQDRYDQLQVYVRRDDVGEEAYEYFKSFDLGDIVEVKGYAFRTKTGEPSLHATSVRLLVKCLSPLPEKWHGLTDVEKRYRQRYLDLIVTPESRERFVMRSKIVSYIRRFFDARNYLEVETPILQPIAGGASARPFITHHNTLDMPLFLRIALELPLKRLIVGGLERVYEISRVFRNEGISTEHNPEFTMIEFYQAFATYEDLMDLTEDLVVGLCEDVIGSTQLPFGEKMIDFSRPWKRISMVDAIKFFTEAADKYDLNTLDGAKKAAHFLGVEFSGTEPIAKLDDYGKVIFEIFDQKVESLIVNPTFITQHPLSISPLARPNIADPRFCDRFELMIAGMELANAFSELNDSEDQRRRFEQQMEAKRKGDDEAMDMDEDFVRALEYGLPPTAGQGIGIDRLVMLLTNAPSIRDVILFPTMRPAHE